ncbi:amino acid adenylation domain-containing protein [Kitasatospora sp. MAP5-34]|uniref:amino acid adenylation domain-containing protein n=1 Tax=Kitasatospora sp. MAP5-34 TaxID=3035102 RepID=UPI002476701F|nr:amino acid adenylation domain-containing protein [Kitasatospora sp. MAP5-34]MDH6575303.1 amino acid adenylation domain-containing protein [Kitasatospora sp. MAP5-34]
MTDRTPLARFEEHARRSPDRIAVRGPDETLSYRELDLLAGRFATVLESSGLRPGDRVGLRPTRGARLAVAVLGCAKAGLPYVPLDPAYPSERTALIADRANLTLTVGDQDFDGMTLLPPQPSPADRSPTPGLAYVIFTSGSTGVPKGVPVTTASLTALFAATDRLFDFGPQDVWPLMHSYNFDFSVWEMWGAWRSGAELAVPDQPTLRSPARTVHWLAETGATVLNQVPTVFGYLVAALEEQRTILPTVRHVIFGGEEFASAPLRRWRGLGHRAAVTNMYGITEATVHATFRRLAPGEEPPTHPTPIGWPLPGIAHRVVDPDLRPVRPGHSGQLLLSGAQLLTGYLGDEHLTAERLVQLPDTGDLRWYTTGDLVTEDADGELHYLGRADRQVQLRGYRIELGEVEAVLLRTGMVRAAAVSVAATPRGDQQLVAHVVPAAAASTSAELRRALAALLPEHMVPSRFVQVAELATTASGKLDRSPTAPHHPLI